MASIHGIPKSPWRAIIESAFFASSVRKTSMAELYALAKKQPEVMVTSEPMYRPEQFDLPHDAKVLVSNDGGIFGRTARARRLVRTFTKADKDKYQSMLSEATYHLNRQPGLWLEGMIGLHPDFMIKAHLLSPETDAKNMLDWGINFIPFMPPWSDLYKESRQLGEPDILVLAYPEWSNPEFKDGLVIIDEDQNCIAILGLRYFGERKKGTLTIAWTVGVRHNMVACHGGIKKIGDKPPVAVFGLSGSGKSSITNSSDHEGTLTPEEKVTVIHDDAFLIDLDHNLSIVLEPSLFDKTDAMEFDDPVVKYFYSAQNMAVTGMADGTRRLVGKDIRNDNGRCLKSRDMFNHANFCEKPSTVIWLQKDTSLPPICKVTRSAMAVAMGASLSTLRAKGVENADPRDFERLVIEPFANPFRVHPLVEDCRQFLKLFKSGCECYVMNTHAVGMPGHLTDIPKTISLSIVTALVRGKIEWKDWRAFSGLQIPKNGNELFGPDYEKKYSPPTRHPGYLRFLRDRMQDRITFLSNKRDLENDMESIFIDPLVASRTVLDHILEPL
ncbi:MAG TPA: phosphoenolpyruvate carboxykinase (ATP) [Syntrophorhabdus sp.]|jgi:phosphoenolpyruvate carboxykinase (ATP)|nr:phosphoenolpyruvate carboxykinase (ATP) [Syntrophorhabdus sp.]OPX96256.1 MAG: Phosphoenolpyruvate carboxykinase (ATP) [Syntrophorhabdus sp. PtaB.Bin027]OQB76367.1 MAG: Phosphoenolpyruvate carboxykinase (ATP) [Deltaproteobacteria bacterium ADurb.Bin135]HNQ46933.1 phosphoenolpyruvate carboxykinase (ATP) [Syntrophorhabdus sp.]HNS77016.1 phosphoenolpyruvate carboxykinase (ATP) [Syntrophorhabdus sp.]